VVEKQSVVPSVSHRRSLAPRSLEHVDRGDPSAGSPLAAAPAPGLDGPPRAGPALRRQ
jgi:hypothetical protein